MARGQGDHLGDRAVLSLQRSNRRLILLAAAQPELIGAGPRRPVTHPGSLRRLFAGTLGLVKRFRKNAVLTLVGAHLVFQRVNILKNIVEGQHGAAPIPTC